MTTPQEMLELADELESEADNIGHNNREINPVGLLLDTAAFLRRLSASPAGNGGRDNDQIALDAAHQIEALPSDLHEAQKTARIQLIVLSAMSQAAVAPDGAREDYELVCVNGHDRCDGGPFEGCPYCERRPVGIEGREILSEEERHAVGHARYQVEHATPDNPECCFDYELVAALIRVVDRLASHPHQPVEDKRAEARIEKLQKLLEPFAEHADRYAIGAPETPGQFQVYVSLADCRNAREALPRPSQGRQEGRS